MPRPAPRQEGTRPIAWQLTDDDILDLTILWHPIGGPPAATIRAAFGIEMNEYRLRLEAAVRTHRQKVLDTLSLPDRIYACNVLEAVAGQMGGIPAETDPAPDEERTSRLPYGNTRPRKSGHR